MAKINTGILANASPLNATQEKSLEKRALEENNVFAYLNKSGELCFTGYIDPELVKDLAWHNVYKLESLGEILRKTVYKKQTQKTFCLAEVLQKQSYEEPWMLASSQANFTFANGDIFVLSDGLIFKTKEN
jgi:hypothetical protein